jgi:archaellum biogenesis protein FlaJ (TadC family)
VNALLLLTATWIPSEVLLDKLTLQGGFQMVLWQWLANISIVLICLYPLWVHRRAQVAITDWIKLFMIAVLISIWMTVSWLLAAIWHDWPFFIYLLMMLAGLAFIYWLVRPVIRRIEDPDKIRRLFHKKK